MPQKGFEKYLSRLCLQEGRELLFLISGAQCEFYSGRDIRARNAQREKKRGGEKRKKTRERERERKQEKIQKP